MGVNATWNSIQAKAGHDPCFHSGSQTCAHIFSIHRTGEMMAKSDDDARAAEAKAEQDRIRAEALAAQRQEELRRHAVAQAEAAARREAEKNK